MAEDDKELIAVIAIVIAAILLLAGAGVGAEETINRRNCRQLSQHMDTPTKYVLFDRCYVMVDGNWVAENMVRMGTFNDGN